MLWPLIEFHVLMSTLLANDVIYCFNNFSSMSLIMLLIPTHVPTCIIAAMSLPFSSLSVGHNFTLSPLEVAWIALTLHLLIPLLC